jgi:hypothetical protein
VESDFVGKKGFRLNRSKTEYMKCDFNDAMLEEGDVKSQWSDGT